MIRLIRRMMLASAASGGGGEYRRLVNQAGYRRGSNSTTRNGMKDLGSSGVSKVLRDLAHCGGKNKSYVVEDEYRKRYLRRTAGLGPAARAFVAMVPFQDAQALSKVWWPLPLSKRYS